MWSNATQIDGGPFRAVKETIWHLGPPIFSCFATKSFYLFKFGNITIITQLTRPRGLAAAAVAAAAIKTSE